MLRKGKKVQERPAGSDRQPSGAAADATAPPSAPKRSGAAIAEGNVSSVNPDGDDAQRSAAADIAAWAELERPSLVAVLTDMGVSDERTIEAVETQAADSGADVGPALVEAGVLTEEQWIQALSQRFGLPIADLEHEEPEKAALEVVGEDLARQHSVLPFRYTGDRVYVAVSDPLDLVAIENLTEKCEHLGLMVASRPAILRALDRNYDALLNADAAIQAFGLVDDGFESGGGIQRASVDENAPVVQVVNRIITQGVRNRASDIHIEPLEGALRVRYRIDGALSEAIRLPLRMSSAIASRVKVLAELNIVERRRPQDGQFSTVVDGRPIDVRTSVVSTIHGEKVVMRILDKTQSLISLNRLGMPEDVVEDYLAIVRAPVGMFLCTGPTGSGKTTTLYATLTEIQDDTRNVMTIEDPVEYEFGGINQMQVHEAGGFTFADGLRGTLRQDPDVILVGEIRDAETAQIAMQASLTGHMVLSSLHSVDAVAAIHRFIDMGIEPFLVGSAITGVIGQRLLRRICNSCKEAYEPDAAHVAMVLASGAPLPDTFYRGAGCSACNNTGYHGRIGVYELLAISDEIRTLIVERASHSAIRKVALREGMRTMQQEAFAYVAAGVTTVDEVIKTVYAPTDEASIVHPVEEAASRSVGGTNGVSLHTPPPIEVLT